MYLQTMYLQTEMKQMVHPLAKNCTHFMQSHFMSKVSSLTQAETISHCRRNITHESNK